MVKSSENDLHSEFQIRWIITDYLMTMNSTLVISCSITNCPALSDFERQTFRVSRVLCFRKFQWAWRPVVLAQASCRGCSQDVRRTFDSSVGSHFPEGSLRGRGAGGLSSLPRGPLHHLLSVLTARPGETKAEAAAPPEMSAFASRVLLLRSLAASPAQAQGEGQRICGKVRKPPEGLSLLCGFVRCPSNWPDTIREFWLLINI